jgi:hypothetical protein
VIAKRFITGLVGAGLVAAATTGVLAGTASAAPAAANVQTTSNVKPAEPRNDDRSNDRRNDGRNEGRNDNRSNGPRIDAKAVDSNRNGKINQVTVKNTGRNRITVRVVVGRVSKTQNVDPGRTITVRDPQDRANTATVTASENRGRTITQRLTVPAPRGGRH